MGLALGRLEQRLRPFEVLHGRLVRLDVLRAGLGGGLRVLIGLELVAHPAAQDEPAGVEPALHVAQDGELLDRLPQLRDLGFDDGLLRGDPGQLVLGPRHFGLGVGEGLGRDVGLLTGLQDLACRLLRRTLVLVGRLRGRSAHPAQDRGRHRGQERAEGEHRGEHGQTGATKRHDGP